jgi:hypothetical protein
VKKILTVFLRGPDGRASRDPEPTCAWVLDGEGVPTRKWDGTCCLKRDGRLYKRCKWDQSKGEPPADWLHHSFDPAERSGHGWLPVSVGAPEDWQHRGAVPLDETQTLDSLPEGTYELIGQRIGKNPEGLAFPGAFLVKHGAEVLSDVPRDFDGLQAFLWRRSIEGIVWHHPDGRMAKITRKDFGIPWPACIRREAVIGGAA